MVDQMVAEQALGPRLAVLVDVVKDHPVILHRPHPPVADLFAGQIVEDQLRVAAGVIRLQSGHRLQQHKLFVEQAAFPASPSPEVIAA
ncbi:hypothetical protein ACFVMA_01190 [Streptomyces rochei]|uniref:hypothetical protein n=1 Tax=Streptomyces rochei TaxID=1928 RepID=UPI00369D1914